MSDALTKIYIESALARGEAVTLEESFREALSTQNWPDPIKVLMGEMAAAAHLVRAATAYRGNTTLQVQGDGPVQMMVVEVNDDFTYRFSALFDESADYTHATMTSLINATGRGLCALILDDKDRPKEQTMPYQGIVPLTGETFSEVMEHYFFSSEQVSTKLVLASNGQKAAGVMIQKLPQAGGKNLPETFDEQAWSRLEAFMATLGAEELLSTDTQTICHRLFWEESPKVVGEATPRYRCRCSREALANVIKRLGRDEALTLLDEKEDVMKAKCEFCQTEYRFTREDIEQLTAPMTQENTTIH